MRQIALDTETTGLSAAAGHRLAEIGCVEIINRKVTGKVFHTYLNPEREVDEGAERISGLNLEFLKSHPLFKNVMVDLLEFINGAELIIHNAQFDLSFINNELALAQHKITKLEPHHAIIDTLLLARKMHPGQKNNLDALCKRYQIDNSKRDKHGALIDAEILAEVYLAMTAGQISFNLGSAIPIEAEGSLSAAANIELITRSGKLHVINATASELDEHQKCLQHIRESNGGISLWDEVTK